MEKQGNSILKNLNKSQELEYKQRQIQQTKEKLKTLLEKYSEESNTKNDAKKKALSFKIDRLRAVLDRRLERIDIEYEAKDKERRIYEIERRTIYTYLKELKKLNEREKELVKEVESIKSNKVKSEEYVKLCRELNEVRSSIKHYNKTIDFTARCYQEEKQKRQEETSEYIKDRMYEIKKQNALIKIDLWTRIKNFIRGIKYGFKSKPKDKNEIDNQKITKAKIAVATKSKYEQYRESIQMKDSEGKKPVKSQEKSQEELAEVSQDNMEIR